MDLPDDGSSTEEAKESLHHSQPGDVPEGLPVLTRIRVHRPCLTADLTDLISETSRRSFALNKPRRINPANRSRSDRNTANSADRLLKLFDLRERAGDVEFDRFSYANDGGTILRTRQVGTVINRES